MQWKIYLPHQISTVDYVLFTILEIFIYIVANTDICFFFFLHK